MQRTLLALSMIAVVASSALAGENRRTYSWVDDDGNLHYGDSIPAEYSELDKRVLNDQGVLVDELEGKKSEEELAEERRLAALAAAKKEQRRKDRALIETYLSVDEIVMHRNRRVELFQAQARVTELFLKNLEGQLAKLMAQASQYQPYSEDPDAPMVDPDLVDQIELTRATIGRHEDNLERFKRDEQEIIERFDGDIKRFEELKGLTASTG